MKEVAYCVDFVIVCHCTKFHSHICNVGDFTEGGNLCPQHYKGPKILVLIGLSVIRNHLLGLFEIRTTNAFLTEYSS